MAVPSPFSASFKAPAPGLPLVAQLCHLLFLQKSSQLLNQLQTGCSEYTRADLGIPFAVKLILAKGPGPPPSQCFNFLSGAPVCGQWWGVQRHMFSSLGCSLSAPTPKPLLQDPSSWPLHPSGKCPSRGNSLQLTYKSLKSATFSSDTVLHAP